jgi:hypothetical protein
MSERSLMCTGPDLHRESWCSPWGGLFSAGRPLGGQPVADPDLQTPINDCASPESAASLVAPLIIATPQSETRYLVVS